jgi:hypothetical protein
VVVVGCSGMWAQILIQAGLKTFCRAPATRAVQMRLRLATGGGEERDRWITASEVRHTHTHTQVRVIALASRVIQRRQGGLD